MKYSLSSLVVASILLVSGVHSDVVDPSCDRILVSMSDGCKGIRSSLISPASMDPKVVCCTQLRYNICTQSVSGYATLAKATRICPAAAYDSVMVDLNSNLAMAAVKALCDKFDTQTCITEPLGNAWSQVKSSANENLNVDIDKLGEQIGQNWHQAMNSIGSFANRIQDSIAKQNIPDRLREGATALQSTLSERTKQFQQGVSDLVAGQGQNRYSVVDGDGKSQFEDSGLSLDSIVHSVIPEVEIVPKSDSPAPVAPQTPSSTNGKRFSIMDWFNSFGSFGSGGSNSNSLPAQRNQNQQIENRNANPYNVV